MQEVLLLRDNRDDELLVVGGGERTGNEAAACIQDLDIHVAGAGGEIVDEKCVDDQLARVTGGDLEVVLVDHPAPLVVQRQAGECDLVQRTEHGGLGDVIVRFQCVGQDDDCAIDSNLLDVVEADRCASDDTDVSFVGFRSRDVVEGGAAGQHVQDVTVTLDHTDRIAAVDEDRQSGRGRDIERISALQAECVQLGNAGEVDGERRCDGRGRRQREGIRGAGAEHLQHVSRTVDRERADDAGRRMDSEHVPAHWSHRPVAERHALEADQLDRFPIVDLHAEAVQQRPLVEVPNVVGRVVVDHQVVGVGQRAEELAEQVHVLHAGVGDRRDADEHRTGAGNRSGEDLEGLVDARRANHLHQIAGAWPLAVDLDTAERMRLIDDKHIVAAEAFQRQGVDAAG